MRLIYTLAWAGECQLAPNSDAQLWLTMRSPQCSAYMKG
jgi:hypothetical protein